MGRRAQVIILAFAALVSAGSIVAIAFDDDRPKGPEIAKLMVFETRFNENMMKAIRGVARKEGSESVERCQSDQLLETVNRVVPSGQIAQITQRTETGMAAGGTLCDIRKAPENTKLRDAVIHYLDRIYEGNVPRSEWTSILKGSLADDNYSDFFSKRVGPVREQK